MKNKLTAILLMIILVCAFSCFGVNAENVVFMENYDFSEMGMSNGSGMGTVKFPDTANKNAWGWHGSSDPKTCIYRESNGESYMEVTNVGTVKNGTTYFWNNFPKPISTYASVSFDIRVKSGKSTIYLMSDSKYDGDDMPTNVPTDWPNIVMELVCQNGEIKFGTKTLISGLDTNTWCRITVDVDVLTKTLTITASQDDKTGTLENVGFTETGKSNVSILSFNPSAGSTIEITNVSMAYDDEEAPEATTGPTQPPVGVVIQEEQDQAEIDKTEELISNKPVIKRQAEDLDRGVVAVKTEEGVFLSWRLKGTESYNHTFNIYKNGELVTEVTDSTNYLDKTGSENDSYCIEAVYNGEKLDKSEEVKPLSNNYLSIPMNIPEGGVTPANEEYTYSVGDCSTGDLNGDGKYEIVVMWSPSNAKDSSHDGYTGNVYIDAYTLDGKQLWRIDLGKNIRAGAHYTQLVVYDLDGDGRAEISCKTGDGTVDGKGNVIGNKDADYRNSNGRIITGPEYVTVFNGLTGEEIYTENYSPIRNDLGDDLYKIWGDSNGNRCERYLAAVAYLDGVKPYMITVRGYYTRTVITAYSFENKKLSKVWTFDTSTNAPKEYMGKGNHNLSVGDIDYDGYDEIVFGSALIDHDGTGIDSGLGHGDAMHFGDLDPTRPGLEVFQVHESSTGYVNVQFRDARTNKMIWGVPYRKDIGRGVSADIDPNYPGEECYAVDTLYSAQGEVIGKPEKGTLPQNFAIWWDGDLQREMADSNKIYKYDYVNKRGNVVMEAVGCSSNNGTKSTPALQADLFGDWREEIAFKTDDSSELRIFTTTDLTEYKLYSLMYDPVYRLGIVWQNVTYNQPPHTSFYMGYDMDKPEFPEIYLAQYNGIYVIGDAKAGESDTVTVKSSVTENIFLVLASYDDKGSLVSIDVRQTEGEGEYILNTEIQGVSELKVMALYDMKNIEPIGEYITIK